MSAVEFAPHPYSPNFEDPLNAYCKDCGNAFNWEGHKKMEGQIEKLTGKKHDGGKPPMALISGTALAELAKVLEFGAKKYDPWNWKSGFVWSRLASAVLRHVFSWLSGEDKDPETGLSHLAHAMCGLMFLVDFEVNKIGQDDRYKSGK